jgi:hypothetical protein
MSHYTVAVFMTDDKQSLADVLAPYDENIQIAPYVASTKAELIQAERNRIQRALDGPYSKWKKNPKKYEIKCKNPNHIEYLKNIPDLMKRTDEELYQEAIKGYADSELTKDGDLLSTYNPDSKWDWYEIGGRWNGELLLRPNKNGIRGEHYGKPFAEGGYDGAFVRDIDFEAMRQKDLAEVTSCKKAIKDTYLKKEVFLARYPTEEEYIKQMTSFSTYAVVTPDGAWHEPGKMGWWGISMADVEDQRSWDRDYYERFIEPAIENNWYMVIVDCHI